MSWLARLMGLIGWRRDVGTRGERAAVRHLRRQGYRVLARNLRSRLGEVDILAEAPDGQTLVIVEVKTSGKTSRMTSGGGGGASGGGRPPELRVNAAKQRKLVALAAQMARQSKLTERPVRFDVVGVDLPPDRAPQVRHYPGAFESRV